MAVGSVESGGWRGEWLPFTGAQEPAVYRTSPVPRYRGNPVIEALPPIMPHAQLLRRLKHMPKWREADRRRPPEVRLHLLQTAAEFYTPLPRDAILGVTISRMIREGYAGRNPLSRRFWADAAAALRAPRPPRRRKARAGRGFYLLGTSGIGKSLSFEENLLLYPQVIYHIEYHGTPLLRKQIVWLKSECPHDGSIKTLLIEFFRQVDLLLDTNYEHLYTRGARMSASAMIPSVARVCAAQSIGLWVIDEVQRLKNSKDAGQEMLDFFVSLINSTGVPVVLIGTHKAQALFDDEFLQARRGSGQGGYIWHRMREGPEWDLFTSALWRYQYQRTPCKLTASLKHALYEISQGIADLAVVAWMLAQQWAILSGGEEISEEVLEAAAEDGLVHVQPALDALRRADAGDKEHLRDFEDLLPRDTRRALDEARDRLGRAAGTGSRTPRCGEGADASGQVQAGEAGEAGEGTSPAGATTDPGARPASRGTPGRASGGSGRTGRGGRRRAKATDRYTKPGETAPPPVDGYAQARDDGMIRPVDEFLDD